MKPSETPAELLTRTIDRVFDAVNDSKVGPLAFYVENKKVIKATNTESAYQRCVDTGQLVQLNQLALQTYLAMLNSVLPNESVVEHKEPKGF